MAEKWPEMWNEADERTPWEPRSDGVPERWSAGGTFLGRWGGYDVRSYDKDAPGISLVDRHGVRTGYFPLMGIAPRESGKVWIDGALRVANDMGLWVQQFVEGIYGPKYQDDGQRS